MNTGVVDPAALAAMLAPQPGLLRPAAQLRSIEAARAQIPRANWPMCKDPACREQLDPLWWQVGIHPNCVDPTTLPVQGNLLEQPAAAYCSDCDHDTHQCPGCGTPVPHGQIVCRECVASPAGTFPVTPAAPAIQVVHGQPPTSMFKALPSPPAAHPIKAKLMEIIRWAEANSARSAQKAIGPSEIGVSCLRRLAYRISDTVPVNTAGDPWFAIIGTAVHEWLAIAIDRYNAEVLGPPAGTRTYEQRRFIVEERVTITSDEHGISGSCDLYDADQGTVIDHKVVGNDALKKYRLAPSDQYRTQVHLYGLGHRNAGRDVSEVAIAFYPRSNFLDEMHVWSEPYDEQRALAALARLAGVRDLAATFQVAQHGERFGLIPAEAGAGCTWCPFFRPGRPADATGCPGVTT